MEGSQVRNKIKMLFAKLVEPDYIMNNYYADSVINKMAHGNDSEVTYLERTPLLSELITNALEHTENAHISVQVFLTRMLAIAAQKELQFARMFSKNGANTGKFFKQLSAPNVSPSLTVAYLEVAQQIVCHNTGMSWILETGIWKEILRLCNEKRTVFVVRQTHKFAAKFLWRLNDLSDEANIKLVIEFILSPIEEINIIHCESITSEQENEYEKTLQPILQTLLAIVTEENKIEKNSIVMTVLIKDFSIIQRLLLLFDRLRKEDVTFLLSRLIFWFGLAKTFLHKPYTPETIYSKEDLMEVAVIYFNTIQYFIQRRSVTSVLDFCNACTVIWTTVFKHEPPHKTEEVKQIELQNQLLVMGLVPCLVYVTYGKDMSVITNDRINDYINKILNASCEHTARAAYALRDLSLELDMLSITLQSVKSLTCLKNYLNDEQANLVFQALFYILHEYDPLDRYGEVKIEEHFEESQEKILVMTYVLDTILSLVKKYNINWLDSIEIVCLYSVVHSILKRPNLSCKFVVTALNLIAVLVKKFVPPNLSLLLESKPGSAIHEIGKLIYMKMHDRQWEIRDSALEVLLVCTEISYIKFPPFQKQIMENSLINVAATIAFNDMEAYVQASALKCVAVASKINAIWEQLITQYPNIQELLTVILRNNQEGMVRKEACYALCEIQQNLRLTSCFKHYLYEHMASSAVSDFHWEVQISALKFWGHVIKSHFNDQGMLDGTFPPVTFSRETRKIVTLNEAEVQRRIIKILDNLANIGCLTVLVKLLHDDPDVEIMEAALKIASCLMRVVNQYKVVELLKPQPSEPKTVDELMCFIKEEYEQSEFDEAMDAASGVSETKADNVIDGILKADDINLLASIYEKRVNINNIDLPVKPKLKLFKRASPYLFTMYMNSKDFNEMVEEKKRWKNGIKSLSSLLDDVLGIYEVSGEVNSLDCY